MAPRQSRNEIETGGAKMDAARRLGIDRVTLYRLMRKLDIGEGD